MNEHFLKALITVGIEFTNDPEYGQVLENFTMRDAEKFAELIVKECADVLVKEMNRLDELDRVLCSNYGHGSGVDQKPFRG